jgi:sodium/bile acid cotransporter 7
MAGVLFPPAVVGMIIVPLMVFHQLQLIACAMIARRLGTDDGGDGADISKGA